MLLELDAEERVYIEFVLATLYRECICTIVTLNLTFFTVSTAICVIYDHSKSACSGVIVQ